MSRLQPLPLSKEHPCLFRLQPVSLSGEHPCLSRLHPLPSLENTNVCLDHTLSPSQEYSHVCPVYTGSGELLRLSRLHPLSLSEEHTCLDYTLSLILKNTYV